MASEKEFLIQAFLTGIYITFVYDILRIFRRVVPHGDLTVSLEDIVFWVYCADRVFLLMYYESNGTLRWFAVLGAIAGMYLYRKLVGQFLVKYVSLILRKILDFLAGVLRFIVRPFVHILRILRGKIDRLSKRFAVKMLKKKQIGVNFLKKQLTRLPKMHKMDS